jgi:hypothetical protein
VRRLELALLAAAAAQIACSRAPQQPASQKAESGAVRITQFYTTTPQLPRGEKGLLCYGVENAKLVWLSPPRKELSAALTRCVEIEPTETTTYTLTAEDGAGQQAKQDLTVAIGAARVKIVEVQVSSVDVAKGDPISICYKVQNAKSVKVTPLVNPSPGMPNCIVDRPARTTSYTVTATGAGGDRDEEHVTVKVH